MTVDSAATPRCANRIFEWFSAGTMFQIGIIVLVGELFFHAEPQLAFDALLHAGLTVIQVGFMFYILGLIRLIALYKNGHWYYGPHARAICAFIGMLIWGQLWYGIIDIFFRTGEIYLSWAVWDSALVAEYFALKRAIMDIRYPPKKDPIFVIDPTAEPPSESTPL